MLRDKQRTGPGRRHRAIPVGRGLNILGLNLDDVSHLDRSLDAIPVRPATKRAYTIAKEINPNAQQRPDVRYSYADRR
jgi:hypothetical protein